jgi:hypothetical protein
MSFHGIAARLTVSLPGRERQVAPALVEAADQVREQKRQILVAHVSVGLVWLVYKSYCAVDTSRMRLLARINAS